MFISWVGPRGIVAAGIASLFGFKLVAEGVDGAEYITPIVFMIVLGTVILNATTAGIVAKMLGVLLSKSNGILMVGAHRASRLIAKYLKDNDAQVVLVDSNSANIAKSQELGIESYETNIFSDDIKDNSDLNDVGFIFALTGNSEVNNFATQKLSEDFGEHGAYSLVSVNELQNPELIDGKRLFSAKDDFINLLEVARDYPSIHETEIESSEDYNNKLLEINGHDKMIPLFIKDENSNEFKAVFNQ